MSNKELAELRSRYQTERDNTILERIRQDIDSLETFIQQFTASQSRTFDFQMHLMIIADTKEELENKKLNLKTFFIKIFYIFYVTRQASTDFAK